MLRRPEAPSKSEIVWPDTSAATTIVSADVPNIIPPALVLKEAAFWRRQWKHALGRNDQGGTKLARDLNEGFVSLLDQSDAIIDLVHMGVPTQEPLKAWYWNGVAAFAYAALSREAFTKPQRPGVPPITFLGEYPADVGLCGDFDPRQPERCGLHVRRGQLSRVLEIDWPTMTTPEHPHWYEGEQIVAAVFTPAQPTDHFDAAYMQRYHQPFDPTDFASVVPYLKTAVLQQTG